MSTCIEIPPLCDIHGELFLPGSKSISNRVLLLAALAQGSTHISNLLHCEDTTHMLSSLKALGANHSTQHQQHTIVGNQGNFPASEQPIALFLGNAGTAVRFLTAVLSLCGQGPYVLSGVKRMSERPLNDLIEALQHLGAHIRFLGKTPALPIEIQPHALSAPPSHICIRGNLSSQFLSGLLIAAPLLKSELCIEIEGTLISKPYVDMTLQLMKVFGVSVQKNHWKSFTVPAQATYHSPGHIEIEPDASSASYFIAAATLGRSSLLIKGLQPSQLQGDLQLLDILAKMGGKFQFESDGLRVFGVKKPLQPFDQDLNHIPDAAMTLAMLALFASGPSRLHNIGSWRLKETDRLDAMATELQKLGAYITTGNDWLEINPPTIWQAATIETYDDHRMAMCFSLAAFAKVPVCIQNPDCVRKTFPEYFSVFQPLCQIAS